MSDQPASTSFIARSGRCTTVLVLESIIRAGLSRMQHYGKLSDELIAANFDQEVSFFYDPATKRLRKRFEKYPDALQAAANFFHNLEKTQTELLKQIQAERGRR